MLTVPEPTPNTPQERNRSLRLGLQLAVAVICVETAALGITVSNQRDTSRRLATSQTEVRRLSAGAPALSTSPGTSETTPDAQDSPAPELHFGERDPNAPSSGGASEIVEHSGTSSGASQRAPASGSTGTVGTPRSGSLTVAEREKLLVVRERILQRREAEMHKQAGLLAAQQHALELARAGTSSGAQSSPPTTIDPGSSARAHALDVENDRLRADQAKKSDDLATVKKAYDELDEDYKKLEALYKGTVVRVNQLTASNTELTDSLASTRTELDATTEKFKSLQSQYDNLLSQYKQMVPNTYH